MEEVVAIKVVDARRKSHFFITWGRAFDAVDNALLSAVRKQLRQFGIGKVRSIELCDTLQAAAGQPYFFEALISFSQQRVPCGRAYPKWRAAHRAALDAATTLLFHIVAHSRRASERGC